jgi:hypothetical protein
MSWHWSRLSTFIFLGLLYASPLSSGDKGLWLSVTSTPIQLPGAVLGGMPPEHTILLPARSGLAPGLVRPQRTEPVAGPAAFDAAPSTAREHAAQIGSTASWTALDEICPSPASPRGPPA